MTRAGETGSQKSSTGQTTSLPPCKIAPITRFRREVTGSDLRVRATPAFPVFVQWVIGHAQRSAPLKVLGSACQKYDPASTGCEKGLTAPNEMVATVLTKTSTNSGPRSRMNQNTGHNFPQIMLQHKTRPLATPNTPNARSTENSPTSRQMFAVGTSRMQG